MADPAGGTENPIFRIFRRMIEPPVLQELFRVEYVRLRILLWIAENGPEILHDCRTIG